MEKLSTLFKTGGFWLFNAFFNLLLSIVCVFTAANATIPVIVMWISFATFEILQTIKNNRPDPVA